MNRKDALHKVYQATQGFGGGGSFPDMLVRSLEALGLIMIEPPSAIPVDDLLAGIIRAQGPGWSAPDQAREIIRVLAANGLKIAPA